MGATTDKKQRAALAKLMAKFRDKTHDRGFDGALVYDVQNEKILLYGVSALASIKQSVSVLPLADLRDPKKADRAVCHALIQLPVLAEP
jgi:ribosomal protein S12 methylthiotransferase accessory factor YcaO